jgi:hypothetical protein
MRMRSKSSLLLACALSVLGFLAVAPAPATTAAPAAAPTVGGGIMLLSITLTQPSGRPTDV